MNQQKKDRKWCNFDFDENEPPMKLMRKIPKETLSEATEKEVTSAHGKAKSSYTIINEKNWIKNFDPVTVDDLAVHNKKVQEVEEWIKHCCDRNQGDMLLLTGPVGCGKTATIFKLASKYNIKVTEWITPLDIGVPSEYGEFEHKEKQSSKFLDFIINAANFTSLLDNNNRKLVLVEDFPNTFLRTPSEFTDVLHQYKHRARSPIVFICSEMHTDNKNTAVNLFTPSLKEQYNIQQIVFNSISMTGLKGALKRIAEIISKKHTAVYNIPTSDMIECVVNSSGGDVRSAVLNLHFACLKGSNTTLETSVLVEKETKSKGARKKKNFSSKFMSIGKDQTVSILHGVGRVLNPKVTEENESRMLTHKPSDIIEQFLSQPSSFVNFLEENYLPHFSSADHADKAAAALSDADYLLAEWREKMCQEYGLYTAVAGLMLANKAPVSAWNPVRGPKNMKIQYPSPHELGLEPNFLYKGKVLVADYQTYCKLISSKTS
ncbi:cell cycle checkpoint protein RAD17 isoform X2 [Amyelois transitella]|uniref:cell cycle checkpoint protein RAD17 isoform X2 n=1 Tax=Amyelois transitella TaxID=680683 RepID=UPI00067DAF6F|nr:cell cycle checkpoint protein RAD17 isoform X2 [Amyelois transitella]